MEQKVTIPCDAFEGCTHIQMQVQYVKDAESWMRVYNRRGYYMDIRPVKIEPCDFNPNLQLVHYDTDMARLTKIFFLEGTERKSAKRLNEFLSKVQAHAKEIAEAFVRQDYNAIWAYV